MRELTVGEGLRWLRKLESMSSDVAKLIWIKHLLNKVQSKMSDWMPVYGSSNVTAVRYHEPSRECEVRFTDGTVYIYEDVPQETFDELVHAQSKGRFVNVVLRRGFKYHRASATVAQREEENGS